MSQGVLSSAPDEEAAVDYYDVIQPINGNASYDGDFAAWAFDQARRLRALKSNDIDIDNVAEEIESLGKGEVNKLESFLRLILLHLLKWDNQPSHRSKSWAQSISTHRRHAAKQLRKNPSLKAVLDEAVEDAYDLAVGDAVRETGLSEKRFPETSPYNFDTIMNRELRLDDPE